MGNGQDGWVQASCKAWMPRLLKNLASIPIFSARSAWEPHGLSSPSSWKARELQSRLSEFYAPDANQCLKNIIVVGDAPYEHEALRCVVQDSTWSPDTCFSKSLKFVHRPRAAELAFQLRTLRASLDGIVAHNGNLEKNFPRRLEGSMAQSC